MLKYLAVVLFALESVSLFLMFLFSFTTSALIPYGGMERYLLNSYLFRYYSATFIASNAVIVFNIIFRKNKCIVLKNIFVIVCVQISIWVFLLIYSLFFEVNTNIMSLAMIFAISHVFPFMLISPVVMVFMYVFFLIIRIYLLWYCRFKSIDCSGILKASD